jgi:hypothetical protein
LPSIKFLTLAWNKSDGPGVCLAGARLFQGNKRVIPMRRCEFNLSRETNVTDEHHADRRSFLRTGAIAGTALVAGASAMAHQVAAETDASNRSLTKGAIAILKFLAAVELIESDLWLQYAELGGVQDGELPGLTGGSALYTAALNVLDGDMSQYIHDNTEDEFSHAAFLNAYLVSKGAELVNLDKFRTLQGSQATGANKTKKTAHQSHAAQSRHQLVDEVSQPRQ